MWAMTQGRTRRATGAQKGPSVTDATPAIDDLAVLLPDWSTHLRARNVALCVADSDKMSTPLETTADYAYFRLRDEGYTPDDVARWGDTIARATEGAREVFVYFKHEEQGKGPEFARLLMQHLGLPT